MVFRSRNLLASDWLTQYELSFDLFPTRLNYKVKPFIVYQPDPEAVDAFTIAWKQYLFHAFPSFSIIPLVFQKIREKRVQD